MIDEKRRGGWSTSTRTLLVRSSHAEEERWHPSEREDEALYPKQEEPKGSTAGSDCFPHTHTHTLSILVKFFGRKQVRLSHCFRAHHLALHSHLRMRPTTWTLSMRTTLPFVSCSLPLRSRSRLSISRVDPIDIPFQGPGFPFRFGRKDDR